MEAVDLKLQEERLQTVDFTGLRKTTMKAFEFQNQFGLEALKLTNRPQPELGSGQILIKVRAASVNYRDWLIVKGAFRMKQRFPLIPLSDGVGEVVAVGEGVTRVKTGDRVAGIFFQTWLDGELTEARILSALGGPLFSGELTEAAYGGELTEAQTQLVLSSTLDGMLAEYIVLHEDGVVHVPEHLTDEEAATLPCAAVTAWNAVMVAFGGVKASDTVLVQGTGGVSIFALQFAQLSGARVIATSSSDEKLERLRQLGASDTINYKQTPDWGKRVREITGGIGVDHIVEVGGPGTLNESLRAVRYGGRISFLGSLTGGGGVINTAAIFLKDLRMQGIYVGSREMFEAMNRAITLHKLRPIVDRVFPFEEAREALAYMKSGAHFGKVCIRF